MASVNFNVIFHGHGFDLERDISEEMQNRVQGEFMEMYNMYANMANEVQDKINVLWDKLERIKAFDKVFGETEATSMALKEMGLTEDNDYYDWCEKWYKDIAEGVDMAALLSGYMLRCNIFRLEDGCPIFGVKFKDRPDWTMDFTVEQSN